MVIGAGFMLDGVRRSLKLGRDLKPTPRVFPGRGPRAESDPEREAFDCYAVCTSCRYIDPEGDDLCRSCGKDEWLDLQLVEMTRILRESEDYTDEQPGKAAISMSWLAVGGAYLMLFVGGIATGFFRDVFAERGAWPIFLLPVLFGVGGFALWLGIALQPMIARMFHHMGGHPDPLLRWAIPSVDIGEPVAGTIELDEALVAPLTGRPCAAWCLTADLREPGGRNPTPVLVEHRSAPMTIGDRSFAADTFAVERIPKAFPKVPRETQMKVVRQRGLLWSDGDFTLKEAIIPLGSEVKSTTEHKARIVTALRPVLRKGSSRFGARNRNEPATERNRPTP